MDPSMAPPDYNAQPPRLPHHTDAYLAADKASMITSTVIAVTVITTLFVIARIFTRQKIMGKMHLDDWLVSISVVLQWIAVACAIKAASFGNGRHFDTLTMNQIEGTIFWTILGFPFGVMAFGIPKLAVVALLTRIMIPSRPHKMFLWTMALTCLAGLIGCIVILFAQCSPVESQWTLAITNKKCISPWVLVHYAMFAGGFSALCDLYLAIYPAYVLWGLQLRLRKKIALCIALGIGSIATIVAIYKCTRLPSLATADFSWNTSDLVIWTVVEAGTIIIACCIPVLQPLVDVIFGRRAMNGSSGYKNYSGSGSGHLKSDIEMEKNRSGNKSHVVRSRGMSAMGNRPEIGSHESILNHKQAVKPASTMHRSQSRRGSDGNRIVRTDVVTVTYDNEDTESLDAKSTHAHDPNSSWARI